MGIVPVLDPAKTEAVAAADQFTRLISPSSQMTVLTVDQLIQAAKRDSISSESYWIQYGRRLGLHTLILTDILRDSVRIRCLDYQSSQDFAVQGSVPEADSLILLCLRRLNLIGSEKQTPIPSVLQQNYWLGRVHQLLGQWSIAFTLYNSIEDTIPEVLIRKVETMIRLGEREQQAGRMSSFYLEAENTLDLLESTEAFQADLLKLRFNLSVLQGSWNRSEALIKEVFSFNPNDASLFFLAARMHPSRFRSMGYKHREQLYKRAIALNPAYVKAYLALGNLYYFRQNMEKSEAVYRDLLRINPESVDAFLALGKIYLYRGETVRLIETYEELLKSRPESPEVIYNLGIAYYNQNQYDRAIQLFQIAGNQYQLPDAYYYLGVIFMKLDRTNEAIESFRRRIDLRQGQTDLYANEAVKFLYQLLQAESRRVDNDAIP